MTEQFKLAFEGTEHEQTFLLWKETPGGRRIMKDAYAITASYVPEWKRTGVPVSATLVFELLRHRIKHVLSRADRMQVKAASMYGFSLNNVVRPYCARHIMDRRPDWCGIFELREVGKKRKIVESKTIEIRKYA